MNKQWKRLSTTSKLLWTTEDVDNFFENYEMATLFKENIFSEIREWISEDPRIGLLQEGRELTPIMIEYTQKESKYRKVNFFDVIDLFLKEKGKRVCHRTGIL